MKTANQPAVLEDIRKRLDAEYEPSVSENIERHYRNLERLAASLHALGLDKDQVDASVLQVFEEYRGQLRDYATTISSERTDG